MTLKIKQLVCTLYSNSCHSFFHTTFYKGSVQAFKFIISQLRELNQLCYNKCILWSLVSY